MTSKGRAIFTGICVTYAAVATAVMSWAWGYVGWPSAALFLIVLLATQLP